MITLLILLSFPATGGADPQRLFIRVVDSECQPIPGVFVEFRLLGNSPERPAVSGVTGSKGETFFDAASGAKYEVNASLPNFISTRVGPLTVTKERSSRPIVVVLNLALDRAMVLPSTGPKLMDKKQ